MAPKKTFNMKYVFALTGSIVMSQLRLDITDNPRHDLIYWAPMIFYFYLVKINEHIMTCCGLGLLVHNWP